MGRGKRNTWDQLEEVFDNPRVLTGSGYKTRAKLREEENEIGADQVCGLSEDYEANAVHYDLYEGLDDIENLRIEDSDDNGMIDDGLYLKRLEFESVSEFDGECQIEKLLSKWDEEESETEDDEEESDEHFSYIEVTSSNEDSENEIEDYTENTEADENDSDISQHLSSGGSDSDDYSESESEGLGTDTGNESEYTSEDLENDNDLDGF